MCAMNSVFYIYLKQYCNKIFHISDAELVPNPAAVHIDSNQATRQGRQRWARSTTTERNLVQSSWTPILSSSTDPDPAQTQPSSSTYFGRKLARDSQILRKVIFEVNFKMNLLINIKFNDVKERQYRQTLKKNIFV